MIRLTVQICACLAVMVAAAAGSADAATGSAPGAGPGNGPQGAGAEQRVPVSMDQVTRHTEMLPAFTLATITDVASEMGFTTGVVAVEGDYPLIIMRDENGAPYAVQPMVCEGNAPGDSCQGLLLLVAMQGAANFPGISLNQVNRFNDLQYYARGHVTRGPTAILSRLVLSDYGTSRGNLATELLTFRTAAYNFSNYLSEVRFTEAPDSAPGETSFRRGVGPGFTSPLMAAPQAGPDRSPLSGPGVDAAYLPRLIEQWDKTGLLDEVLFPGGN